MLSSSSCSHCRKARIVSKGFAGAMVLLRQFHQLKDLVTPRPGRVVIGEDQSQFRHGLAHKRVMRRWLRRCMLSLRHKDGERMMVRCSQSERIR